MFERYTERARRVIFFARHEAMESGCRTIETEHFLIGLHREDKKLIRRFLGDDPSVFVAIREEIKERTANREKVPTPIDLPLSNECKRILAYANEEAERLQSRQVTTEHFLLGILREEHCLAAEILTSRGLRLEAIREELVRNKPDHAQRSEFLDLLAVTVDPRESVKHVVISIEKHGFFASKHHLLNALSAGNEQKWETAQSELQLFIETLIAAARERLNGEDVAFPIFEGFDWQTSLRGLRSGLAAAEDWKFRWWLSLLLADVLIKRFEGHLNS